MSDFGHGLSSVGQGIRDVETGVQDVYHAGQDVVKDVGAWWGGDTGSTAGAGISGQAAGRSGVDDAQRLSFYTGGKGPDDPDFEQDFADGDLQPDSDGTQPNDWTCAPAVINYALEQLDYDQIPEFDDLVTMTGADPDKGVDPDVIEDVLSQFVGTYPVTSIEEAQDAVMDGNPVIVAVTDIEEAPSYDDGDEGADSEHGSETEQDEDIFGDDDQKMTKTSQELPIPGMPIQPTPPTAPMPQTPPTPPAVPNPALPGGAIPFTGPEATSGANVSGMGYRKTSRKWSDQEIEQAINALIRKSAGVMKDEYYQGLTQNGDRTVAIIKRMMEDDPRLTVYLEEILNHLAFKKNQSANAMLGNWYPTGGMANGTGHYVVLTDYDADAGVFHGWDPASGDFDIDDKGLEAVWVMKTQDGPTVGWGLAVGSPPGAAEGPEDENPEGPGPEDQGAAPESAGTAKESSRKRRTLAYREHDYANEDQEKYPYVIATPEMTFWNGRKFVDEYPDATLYDTLEDAMGDAQQIVGQYPDIEVITGLGYKWEEHYPVSNAKNYKVKASKTAASDSKALGELYAQAAQKAFDDGIDAGDQDQLVQWIQSNCSYDPNNEFFLVLGIGSALADLQSQSKGYKHQVDEAYSKAVQKYPPKDNGVWGRAKTSGFVSRSNLTAATRQAQANALSFGRPYYIVSTSMGLNVERDAPRNADLLVRTVYPDGRVEDAPGMAKTSMRKQATDEFHEGDLFKSKISGRIFTVIDSYGNDSYMLEDETGARHEEIGHNIRRNLAKGEWLRVSEDEVWDKQPGGLREQGFPVQDTIYTRKKGAAMNKQAWHYGGYGGADAEREERKRDSEPFKTKMMPGQEPYTEDEHKRVRKMVSDAASAGEHFSEDELEEHARKQKKTSNFFGPDRTRDQVVVARRNGNTVGATMDVEAAKVLAAQDAEYRPDAVYTFTLVRQTKQGSRVHRYEFAPMSGVLKKTADGDGGFSCGFTAKIKLRKPIEARGFASDFSGTIGGELGDLHRVQTDPDRGVTDEFEIDGELWNFDFEGDNELQDAVADALAGALENLYRQYYQGIGEIEINYSPRRFREAKKLKTAMRKTTGSSDGDMPSGSEDFFADEAVPDSDGPGPGATIQRDSSGLRTTDGGYSELPQSPDDHIFDDDTALFDNAMLPEAQGYGMPGDDEGVRIIIMQPQMESLEQILPEMPIMAEEPMPIGSGLLDETPPMTDDPIDALHEMVSDWESDKEDVEDAIKELKDQVDDLVEEAEGRGFEIHSSDEIEDSLDMSQSGNDQLPAEPPMDIPASPANRGLVPEQMNEVKPPNISQRGQ
jgi:hypothetical protein